MKRFILFVNLIFLLLACSREWSNPLSPDEDNSISIPTEGLVAYYPFNGNANDESGNRNNGIVYGATMAIDRFGNSNSVFSFDGIDDYIDFNMALLPVNGSDFSISLWVNSNNNIDTNIHGIFAQYQSNLAGRFAVYEFNGIIKFFFRRY